MWDRSSDSSVAGYLVFVGTQPGTYAQTFDVGGATSFAYPSAAPGQRYYFAVASYFQGPVIGPKSAEVSGSSNGAPVLVNPGSQSSTLGQPVGLQLAGSDPAGQPLTYGASSLPPGLTVSQSTGFISGIPSAVGSFVVTAIATDGVLSDAETFTWTVNQAPASSPSGGDTTAPLLTITVPTSGGTYTTDQTSATIGGSAQDDGVVTEVEWSTDRGLTGRATGTENWIAGVPLARGPNVITVRAKDNAGNVSSRSITVKSAGKAKK